MERRTIARPGFITLVLVLQLIPLILFPPARFSPQSQEWWLPVILMGMVLFADVALLVQRREAVWPWQLMSFAQGFNIISRLMMLWPNMTFPSGQANVPYVVLTLVSIALSGFLLWYADLPEVRTGLFRH